MLETARDGAIRVTARLCAGPAFGRDALPAPHPQGKQGWVPAVGCVAAAGCVAAVECVAQLGADPLRGFLADLGCIWCWTEPTPMQPLSMPLAGSEAPGGAARVGAVEPPWLHHPSPNTSSAPSPGSKHTRGVAFVFSKLQLPQSCES